MLACTTQCNVVAYILVCERLKESFEVLGDEKSNEGKNITAVDSSTQESVKSSYLTSYALSMS